VSERKRERERERERESKIDRGSERGLAVAVIVFPALPATAKPFQQPKHSERGLAVAGNSIRWLRLVGSTKLQVSFAEYGLFYRACLQKRLIILRSLLIVATP